MSIYIRLNKDLNPKELLQKLQQEINNHKKDNDLKDSILCIDIKNIVHVVEEVAQNKALEYMENKE